MASVVVVVVDVDYKLRWHGVMIDIVDGCDGDGDEGDGISWQGN